MPGAPVVTGGGDAAAGYAGAGERGGRSGAACCGACFGGGAARGAGAPRPPRPGHSLLLAASPPCACDIAHYAAAIIGSHKVCVMAWDACSGPPCPSAYQPDQVPVRCLTSQRHSVQAEPYARGDLDNDFL